MARRVLVTGGAGFIGSSLVRTLLQQDWDVDVLDAFYKGKREYLPDNPRVTVFDGDVADSDILKQVFARSPTHVIHLAAHHFIPFCNDNPTETIRSNVLGTQCLLENMVSAPEIIKLVFASSAAIYAPMDQPCKEVDEVDPVDIYGLSKQIGEQLVRFHCDHRQTRYALARIFNVIGPRETNQHLLPDIIEQLGTDEIELGNLVPRRDYVFVGDVASALGRLLESDVPSGPYNIGFGESHSVSEIVNSVAHALGRELTIRSAPERQRAGDRPILQSDCAKLKKFGWTAEYDLDRALAATLEYYGKSRTERRRNAPLARN